VYARPYDHTDWPDHVERVAYTARLLRAMSPHNVADLSCGDGAVVGMAQLSDIAFLGDYTGGRDFTGPIERTIEEIPPVDVFVCSETLEHIEDPDALLRAIRGKARRLLLTTPCGESDARNPQHYWGWDTSDLDAMLAAAGWTARDVTLFTAESNAYYTFQVWRCA
jgi:hypothetical protein